jgi:hypothetical protein
VTVGTFRDVTAEHYAIQRESTLASLSTRLSQAGSLSDALAAALAELKDVWRAPCVLAAVFGRGDEPALTATDPALDWHRLPAERREALSGLRRRPLATPVTDATGAGILQWLSPAHAAGRLGDAARSHGTPFPPARVWLRGLLRCAGRGRKACTRRC